MIYNTYGSWQLRVNLPSPFFSSTIVVTRDYSYHKINIAWISQWSVIGNLFKFCFSKTLRFGGLYIIATNHDLSILINYAIKSGLYINGVGTIETYQLKAFYCHINSFKISFSYFLSYWHFPRSYFALIQQLTVNHFIYLLVCVWCGTFRDEDLVIYGTRNKTYHVPDTVLLFVKYLHVWSS